MITDEMTAAEIIATAFDAELRLPTYHDMQWMLRSDEGYRYWMRLEELPKALRSLVIERSAMTGKKEQGADVWVMKQEIPGQHYEGTPGWRLAILPHWNEGGHHVIFAEAGCDHELVTTNLGRCYNKSACQHCDFTYFVDSGD